MDTNLQIIPVDEILKSTSTPAASPDLVSLQDKFSRMMEAAPSEAHASVQPPSAMDKFINAEQSALDNTVKDVKSLVDKAPGMSMQELTAQQVSLQYELAAMQLQFTAGIHVAQSSKSGLQTLLKNQ